MIRLKLPMITVFFGITLGQEAVAADQEGGERFPRTKPAAASVSLQDRQPMFTPAHLKQIEADFQADQDHMKWAVDSVERRLGIGRYAYGKESQWDFKKSAEKQQALRSQSALSVAVPPPLLQQQPANTQEFLPPADQTSGKDQKPVSEDKK